MRFRVLRRGLAPILFLGLVTCASAAPPVYRIVDLGVPEGYQSATGNSLNDKGEVVGMLFHAGLPENYRSYFLWSPGLGMRIWDGAGKKDREPNPQGLNNRGKVVGRMQHEGRAHTDAFVATKGGLRKLGQLQPGGRSWANEINDAGVVIGQATVDERFHAFRWTAQGGMVDLQPAGALESYAGDINAAGAIAAWYRIQRESVDDDAIYIAPDGTVTQLDCLLPDDRSHQCHANGINNLDQVVGQSSFIEEIDGRKVYRQHAFLWSPQTGSIDLTRGYEDRAPTAGSINDSGQVIGSMLSPIDGVRRTAYWDRVEGWHDLVDLIDPEDPLLPGLRLVSGGPINRWGQVLVNAGLDNVGHALLLVPVR